MADFTKEELESALQAITSLGTKCEKAQTKIARGTAQWTLLENRIKALHIASALITKSLKEG